MPVGSNNFPNRIQENISKQQQEQKDSSDNKKNSFRNLNPESLIGRMAYQAKVISQIITFIWFYGDKDSNFYDIAMELKGYFTEGNERKLARLMKVELNDKTKEGRLLCQVFPDIKPNDPYYVFPIFDTDAVDDGFISFSIDTNIFSGWITDVDANNPSTLSAVFAFPPRPQYSDVTVTKAELEQWLKDRSPYHIKSSNIYIPTCTT